VGVRPNLIFPKKKRRNLFFFVCSLHSSPSLHLGWRSGPGQWISKKADKERERERVKERDRKRERAFVLGARHSLPRGKREEEGSIPHTNTHITHSNTQQPTPTLHKHVSTVTEQFACLLP